MKAFAAYLTEPGLSRVKEFNSLIFKMYTIGSQPVVVLCAFGGCEH